MGKAAIPRTGYDYRWACPQADNQNYSLHIPVPKPAPASGLLPHRDTDKDDRYGDEQEYHQNAAMLTQLEGERYTDD